MNTKELTGPANCTYCVAHNQEVCRSASHVRGGLVSCIACRRASIPMDSLNWDRRQQPKFLTKVVVELASDSKVENLFKVTSVTSGEGTGAVAQGFGPEDIATTILLAYCLPEDSRTNPHLQLQISYTPAELAYAGIGDGGQFDESIAKRFDRLTGPSFQHVPEAARTAMQKLLGWGFDITHAELDSAMRCVMFIRGKKVPGSRSVLGVRAQLTWIAD